ncbi:hypothetical protein HDU87_000002 [Geranomyces variabilis]|uniref:Uncharacterized protein n=1 Tax=Geranomyces variabilis TaxID=109894 RepID=A0AAD5TRK2_9FUNG|nr:hypothetical protein HDU87_000002 [Geranomyces variabilis]
MPYDLLLKQLKHHDFQPALFARECQFHTEATCVKRIEDILMCLSQNPALDKRDIELAQGYAYQEDEAWVLTWAAKRRSARDRLNEDTRHEQGSRFVHSAGKRVLEELEEGDRRAKHARRSPSLTSSESAAAGEAEAEGASAADEGSENTECVPNVKALGLGLAEAGRTVEVRKEGTDRAFVDLSLLGSSDLADNEYEGMESDATVQYEPDLSDDSAEMFKPSPKGLVRAFESAFKLRDVNNDTILPSGLSLEGELYRIGLLQAEAETLIHSWIVDLNAGWVMDGFSKEDRLFLEKQWKARRPSSAELDDREFRWHETDTDLGLCEQELEAVEAKLDSDDDITAFELWQSIACQPIAREDERPKKGSKITGIRMLLLCFLREWQHGDIKVTNESSAFERMWDLVFYHLRAKGLEVAARETTMAASKQRKLLTYQCRKNLRGLMADKAWTTTTGQILVWGEGKRGSWTDAPEVAESCRAKAIKGANRKA